MNEFDGRLLNKTLERLGQSVDALTAVTGELNTRLTVIETEIADSRERHKEKVSWSQMIILSVATLLGGGVLAMLAERAMANTHH